MHASIEKLKKSVGLHKIAGLMMLHYFKWPWCLKELQNYVDEIYLLLHYSPKFREEWPIHTHKVVKTLEVRIDEEWQVEEWRKQQGTFRERLLRVLDECKPDLVFFPDKDEAFPEPELLLRDLTRLWRSHIRQLAFKRCNFWDSMDMVRKDRWIYYCPHVKIFKWQPQLTYLPYLGFNAVSTYGNKNL